MRIGAFVLTVLAFTILASFVFYLDSARDCGSLPCVANYLTGNIVFEEQVLRGENNLEVISQKETGSLKNFFEKVIDLIISPFISEEETFLQLSPTMNCNFITQYGITWTFSDSVSCGQFVNGDWWVLGPVTINSITPDFENGMNGWQVNPSSFTEQGYDSRGSGYNSNLVSSLPLIVNSPSSIIKTISNSGNSCGYNPGEVCYIDTASVLTVFNSMPSNNPSDLFRPAFAGSVKNLYDSNNIQTQLLPSLVPPAGIVIPSIASIENNFERVQLDYPGWAFRSIHPDQNIRNYGADISLDTGDAALRLMLNDDLSLKMNALINYIQAGIDYAGMISNGADYSTSGGGGHENGRLAPVVFAGIMLNDETIKNLAINSGLNVFGENNIATLDTTGLISLASQEIQYCTEESYWRIIHNPDSGGAKTCLDPYRIIDGGEFPLDPYQSTFSTSAVGGVLSILLLPGGDTVWDKDISVNYLKRWVPDGAWTQPDTCAPAPGLCVGGSANGQACSSAVASYNSVTGAVSFPCPGGGTCSLATNWPHPQYGVTYGSNGAGGCILDTNSLDGIGRFPNIHLVGHGDGYNSDFADAMWETYISTTGVSVPNAPINLVATTQSSTMVLLNWGDESSNENGFNLEYKLSTDSTWTHLATTLPEVSSYTHGGLQPNTLYDYRVYAFNSGGSSAFSISSTRTNQCSSVLNGCPIPIYTRFSSSLTTNFAQVTDLTRVADMSVGIEGRGRIQFLGYEVSVLRLVSGVYQALNLDNAIIIENNRIGLDSALYPELDQTATLTFNGLAYLQSPTPTISSQNGFVVCPSTICQIISYINGVLVMRVVGFSEYSTQTATCGDNFCNVEETCSTCAVDCGACPSGNPPGGGGGGGAGGGGSSRRETILVTQCNDGLDNDGDYLIDFPNDTGCSDILDNIELDSKVLAQNEDNNFVNESSASDEGVNKEISLNVVFWIVLIVIVFVIIVVVIRIVYYTKGLPRV